MASWLCHDGQIIYPLPGEVLVKLDLEEALEVPAARLDADEAPELPVQPSESSATEDEDEAPGAGSPARRRRAKSDKRSVGFAVPA